MCLILRHYLALDFGIEVEESVYAHAELSFDLFAAAFKDMHGDVSLVAIVQGYGRFAHRCHLIGRQQPHSIDQRKICHSSNCFTKCEVASFSDVAHLH